MKSNQTPPRDTQGRFESPLVGGGQGRPSVYPSDLAKDKPKGTTQDVALFVLYLAIWLLIVSVTGRYITRP